MNSKISEIFYTFCPVICVSQIAQQKGWLREEFSDEGITISHISALPIQDWQFHFSHKHPRLFRDGGNIPPIWAKSEGVNTKVTGMTWAEQGQVVMVSNDSAIKSVKQLKGKRLALPRRLPNLIDFRRARTKRAFIMSLKTHGLTEDDIRWVDIPIDIPDIVTETRPSDTTGWKLAPKTLFKIPQEPEVDALRRGEVDAIFSSNGNEIILEQTGAARILYDLNSYSDWKYKVNINYPYVTTVSGDLATEHPEIVVRWMKVLVRAGLWAKKHRLEVDEIFAKEIEAGKSIDAIRKSFPDDYHERLVPEISEKGIEALEIEKNFLREHGFINNDFSITSWVDGSFLDAALKEIEAQAV